MYNYKKFYLANEEIKLDFLPINKKITHLFIEKILKFLCY